MLRTTKLVLSALLLISLPAIAELPANSLQKGNWEVISAIEQSATTAKDGVIAGTTFVKDGVTYAAKQTKNGIAYAAVSTKNGVVASASFVKDGVTYVAQQTKDGVIYVASSVKDLFARKAIVADKAVEQATKTEMGPKVSILSRVASAAKAKAQVGMQRLKGLKTAVANKLTLRKDWKDIKTGQIFPALGVATGVITGAEAVRDAAALAIMFKVNDRQKLAKIAYATGSLGLGAYLTKAYWNGFDTQREANLAALLGGAFVASRIADRYIFPVDNLEAKLASSLGIRCCAPSSTKDGQQ